MLKTLTPILLLISTPALALDPAYLGFWAPDPASCREDERTAFGITPNGISSKESECKITKATADGAGWNVRPSCATEGSTSTLNLRWQLAPNGHLRETQNRKTSDYVRCGK